jgi:hypothetical protein
MGSKIIKPQCFWVQAVVSQLSENIKTSIFSASGPNSRLHWAFGKSVLREFPVESKDGV